VKIVENNTCERAVFVRLVAQLPACHVIYLRHVICVLQHIAEHSDYNNMTARNLSVCVAQNLLWPPRRTGAAEMLVDVSRVSHVCERLIESAADVFGQQSLELFADTSSTKNVFGTDDNTFDSNGQ